MKHYELKHNEELSLGIANFFAMFDENRSRLLDKIKDITDEMLDFTPDEDMFETIGTLLYHIAAVEHDWIFFDIDKIPIDEEKWIHAFANRFDDVDQLTGKGLQFYLDALEEVRQKIYERFKLFTDEDLKKVVESEGRTYTIEWILFHMINHEALHIGQIAMLKRLYTLHNG